MFTRLLSSIRGDILGVTQSDSAPELPGISDDLLHKKRRSIFDKYSDVEKGNILWKVSMAITCVSLALSMTGMAINKFDLQKEVELELNGHQVTIPSLVFSFNSIEIGTDGCEDWKVDPIPSRLHGRYGMTFYEISVGGVGDAGAEFFGDDSKRLISNIHMGDFDAFNTRGTIAKILAILGVGLQVMAVIWMFVMAVPPSGFFFNRGLFGQDHKDHLKGALYMLMLMTSAALLFSSLATMSSIMQPLSARVANFALDWCKESPFDKLARGQAGMEYMQYLGKYVRDHADATGPTFITLSLAIVLIYLHFLLMFYLGVRQVRTQSRVNYHLPDTQLRALPWYAKIWNLKYSLGLLVVSVGMHCAATYLTRVRGYPLNMYFYENAFLGSEMSRSWSLSDIILDRVHRYVIDTSIVKMLIGFWTPVIAIVAFGTIDIQRYFSKVAQLIGILISIGSVLSISTVPPTPAFVLQKPQCYEEPQKPPTLTQFFSPSESCNNQISSLYAVLIVFSAMAFWFYVRYGSIRRKKLATGLLMVAVLVSLFIVVATRQQYSVDVYIGGMITFLFAIGQGPAFKLLFQFGTVHPGMLHKAPIVLSDEIAPELDDIIRRFELFSMARTEDETLDPDQIILMKAEFNNITEAIQAAKKRALEDMVLEVHSLPNSDEDDDEDSALDGYDKKNA